MNWFIWACFILSGWSLALALVVIMFDVQCLADLSRLQPDWSSPLVASKVLVISVVVSWWIMFLGLVQ